MIAEKWKAIPGFEGLYEVSDRGRVRSLNRNEMVDRIRFGKRDQHVRQRSGGYVATRIDRQGRLQLCLWKENKPHYRCVHRLVLIAFKGEQPSRKHEARHLDGDALNNHVSNLAWGTHRENVQDSIEHGTWTHGEMHGKAKLTDAAVRRIRSSAKSQRALAEEFGVSQSTIWQVLQGNNWKHVNAQIA